MKPLTLARGPLRVPAVRGLLVLCAMAPALPQPAAAQRTAADSAAILLAAAVDLQARGELETAQLLHSLILESFPGTAAAESAEARLGVIAKDRSRSGGEIELKVWSALFGLWQGLAIPDAMNAGNTGYGVGLLAGACYGMLRLAAPLVADQTGWVLLPPAMMGTYAAYPFSMLVTAGTMVVVSLVAGWESSSAFDLTGRQEKSPWLRSSQLKIREIQDEITKRAAHDQRLPALLSLLALAVGCVLTFVVFW